MLTGCYRESLVLARDHGLRSIAFPAISTGIFGYPLDAATEIAVSTVRAELTAAPVIDRVIFCTFGEDAAHAYRTALAR